MGLNIRAALEKLYDFTSLFTDTNYLIYFTGCDKTEEKQCYLK